MVQVRKQDHIDAGGGVDIGRWLDGLPLTLDDGARSTLAKAAEQVRLARGRPGSDVSDWAAGSDCYRAGLDTVLVLSDLQVDLDCLLAGMAYRAVREGRLSVADVETGCGSSAAQLVEGVLRMAAVSDLPLQRHDPVLGQADAQTDNIRKMLVALVDDVRVALIKLAERTCALRAVKDDEERRRVIGQEVFDVYAPLAHRLGIGHLKWELEDLSFRYIYADAYRKIAGLLDGKRLERDDYIESVRDRLTQVLQGAGFDFEIAGRAKHIYSIWRKMQRKGIGFSQVYDIRAVRILVPEVADCYATLGLVHSLWRNIPNEFDDYIANPKENGYRSLHTAVIGPGGKVLEVQIRTHQMHEEAELGVCAHWRYKGTEGAGGMASSYEEKIAWLRKVLDWHEETGDAREVAEQFSFDVAQDRVYVFTPDGDIVNLAQGATPLDFAYHVHTEIGHHCRGAKVNGSIVPLTYRLNTGERVEILTSEGARPRRDWLQPGHGYIKTSRARAQVQHWFRSQDREENIDAGRHLLDKELRRLPLTSVDYQRIARKVMCATVEDMYASAGAGDLSSAQVLQAAHSLLENQPETERRLSARVLSTHLDGATIEGAGAHAVHTAGCCSPLPGDEIEGFLTKHRGVSVHRRDCARLARAILTAPERRVELSWGEGAGSDYEVDVAIEAYDRQGLLRDITGSFANARLNVLAINTLTNKDTNTATMRLRVEVPDITALTKLLERIERLKHVVSARRLTE